MGNSKNKKVPKKRKASTTSSNKSKCKSSSDQKENMPKNEKDKVKKPNPDDSISMSKQLLLKKNTVRQRRQHSSTKERVCPNGKPIPSLADLEKMFEDSDDDNDDDDQPPKTPSQKQSPAGIDEQKLMSPSTINKISERMLDLISNIDPVELLESAPPPPIIPPKKRKKPDVPYIVGCKNRPQVIRKPNTNFCKGDDDYGVEPGGCEEDEPATKRAKKSRIPNYSKSIFNAKSDEIAERLTKEDNGGSSDASSDSNKTIEYDPTVFQIHRPRSFSPLPSTSKDNATFLKNDKLFNESLKETNLAIETTPDESEDKHQSPLNVKEDELQTLQNSEEDEQQKPINEKEDEIQIPLNKKEDETQTPINEKEDELQIIDIPYDTIVIDDVVDKPLKLQNVGDDIEIIETEQSEDIKPKYNNEMYNNDDCIIVASSARDNQNNSSLPIVIDDEYSSIDMTNYPYDKTEIEIIDVDDVIAENNSILDKWKSSSHSIFDKIHSVIDISKIYKNSTTPQTNVIPSTPSNLSVANNNEARPQNTPINHNSQILPSDSRPVTQRGDTIQQIVGNFFQNNSSLASTSTSPRSNNNTHNVGALVGQLLDTIKRFESSVNSVNSPGTLQNQNAKNKKSRNKINVNPNPKPRSDISETQATNTSLQTNPPPSSRNIGDCPICMDPLSSNGIASTICGHVFCLQCIQAAIRTNGKKCPTCRKILKGAGGGYHQLYL